MRTPVTRSVFDKRGRGRDGTKSRRSPSPTENIKVGQMDLGSQRVWVRERVGVMGGGTHPECSEQARR